jgi:cysteine desulfurase family protein (TIGR01976 family)
MSIDIDAVRSGFPALSRALDGEQVAYLDGPGGTQVHTSVIDAMSRFMERGGSNLGGPFVTSRETVAVVGHARAAVADLFGAEQDEIVFGQNMTSLTYAMSRALGRSWDAGSNIVLTRLDHDANVSPWMQAAQDADVEVRFVDFDPGDGCSLDLTSLDEALDERTELVAFTHASNAVGTTTPVGEIVDLAHAVGALTYVDAVHFAPHGLIDVGKSGTDFLVASAYKWFGPHTGCLFGRSDLLENIQPYKLRPSPDHAPDSWETGTQSFESMQGVTAAVDYIASLGDGATRRERIASAYAAIGEYESVLSDRFLSGIATIPRTQMFGRRETGDRTPTFAIDIEGVGPAEVARRLGAVGCFVWSGDYYAHEVMHRLDRPSAGLVRIGFVHYNTIAEVDRVLSEIETVSRLTRS